MPPDFKDEIERIVKVLTSKGLTEEKIEEIIEDAREGDPDRYSELVHDALSEYLDDLDEEFEDDEEEEVGDPDGDPLPGILGGMLGGARRATTPKLDPKEREAAEDEAREELIKTETDYDTFSSPDLAKELPPDEEATLGIIDKMKGKKTMKTKKDVGKTSLFIKWFEKYLNSIYSSFYKTDGKLVIKPGKEGGFVNLDSMLITLYEQLVTDLWESGVPPLLIFYHEIGHVLYTTKNLGDYGKSLKPEMFMLLNWLEDYFIEDKLMKELYYIKPYIKMLHEIVPDHIDDWEKKHFALHYYYCYEGMTPRWMDKTEPTPIAATFKRYIEQLKHLRLSFDSRFAKEKFIRMFEEFYTFCVKWGILTKETPPPPTDPSAAGKGGGKGKGAGAAGEKRGGKGGAHTGSGAGSGGSTDPGVEDESATGAGEGSYADDEGEDVPESEIIRPPFKPLDPAKGFDPVFKDLMGLLEKEFDKSMFDTFKLAKKGKPELVPITIPTTSPRSMVDPIAIETSRSDIYLEYITEEFSYTAYNLFIDVSGSVGHNVVFNTLGRDIIKIISHYPYAVYGYGNDVTKWDQKKIDAIMDLTCGDGTESPIIGDIILEKKELGNLNIILSDGDLGNLVRRADISAITKQYLFVFVVSSGGGWGGFAEKYFDKNQWCVLNTAADLPKGLAALKKYIDSKGL